MSNTKRERMTGRRNRAGGFSMLIHEYFQSPQYAALSARAVKLLVDVYCQYRGQNNGDLTACWAIMKDRGWTSKSQLAKAQAELEGRNWLLRTRQGGINKATLYAVTFQGIDACGGKLDQHITPSPTPLHLWRLPTYSAAAKSGRKVAHRPALRAGQLTPCGGAMVTDLRTRLPRVEGQSCA